tara:strand:- start:294 stop:1553 length:1260 start_codon:yes stop_codon:yes gene_type:complete
MKDEVILKVENLSKQYRLGTIGTGTISHDFNRFWAKIRGKEDPYLKIGESNDRSKKGASEYVWALKDINFEVKRGEVLGIIGKNGAGKSTLLKILSKVTGPTTGAVKSNGRIASLLEVGTGFHPEMTGKENVFLNGAILGMTKKEIANKLDEIIEFSGCQRYIDTPVKRYSSGMTVRLAFAVAAHLEPDVLVVDEVLAVGDIEFQKKAIGKMKDISNSDGRTVLFVSHNMAAVRSLCNRAIVLNNGKMSFEGSVDDGLNHYKELSKMSSTNENIKKFKNKFINLEELSIQPKDGDFLCIRSGVDITIQFKNFSANINLDCTVEIINEDEVIIYHNGALVLDNNNSKVGSYQMQTHIPPFLLNAGFYKVNLIFGKDQKYVLLDATEAVSFEIDNYGSTASTKKPGIIYKGFEWETHFIDE